MALTTDMLAEVRTWLPWDPPTDETLQLAHDQLGETSIYPLIVAQLRTRIMTLAGTPASFTIVGDYSQSTGKNLDFLEKQLAKAEAALAAEGLSESAGISTAQLVRHLPYPAGRTASAVRAPDTEVW